jgi:hypothetical protein
MTAMTRFLLCACLMACSLGAADTPQPPKPDLPYLQMADNLVPTEALVAQSQNTNGGKKNQESVYWIAGEHSSAKTPLASPIFYVKRQDLDLDKLEVYPFELKNGRREVTFSTKRTTTRYSLTISKAAEDIYRMEVNESLPPGEYAITPNGSDQVFCFAVY